MLSFPGKLWLLKMPDYQLALRQAQCLRLRLLQHLLQHQFHQPSPSASSAKTITINETELGYLRIRDGPDTSFEEVGQVTPGQTFDIFEEFDPSTSSGQVWYQIEYEKGKYGWVSGTYVTVSGM